MWIEFLSMLPSTIYLIAKGFRPQAKLYFDTPFFKFVAVFLGVGVIAVVMIWD
jgi:zinc transporter 1/2/3